MRSLRSRTGGIVLLALTTGLLGVLARGVILGASPAAALSTWEHLAVPVLAGAAAFTFRLA